MKNIRIFIRKLSVFGGKFANIFEQAYLRNACVIKSPVGKQTRNTIKFPLFLPLVRSEIVFQGRLLLSTGGLYYCSVQAVFKTGLTVHYTLCSVHF